ncbi:hypothetical protein GCM10023148_24160 [Actinokineospora soli]
MASDLVWGLAEGALPSMPGRFIDAIPAAAAAGQLGGLLVGGVDPNDLADPELALRALSEVGFLVSLELRHSAVTAHADVVLPVAAAVEKSGSFRNWEGRHRPFGNTLESTGTLPDCRVLDTLAVEMDADLFTQTPDAAAADLAKLTGPNAVERSATAPHVAAAPQTAGSGEAVLATWRMLLDNGSLQDGEPHLAGTQRPVYARMSLATATALGVAVTGTATVSTSRGDIAVPVQVADLPDGVVWLPTNSPGSAVHPTLGAGHGDVVSVAGSEGGN